VPKPATDRRLLTTTKHATKALEDDLKLLRHVAKRDGADLWHVRILEWDSAEDPGKPYLEIDFVIGERDGQLSIARWSISGLQMLPAEQRRPPLDAYAKTALFAVEDALAADELTYEEIMTQELPHHGSLTNDKLGWVYKEYRLVDGHVEDPRGRKPKPPPRRPRTTPKSEELSTRPARAVEYRQAIERGSRSPTADVARALNVGRSTAARALAAAREQGLLGPALRNRAGESPSQ
jgi:hypothetical protein